VSPGDYVKDGADLAVLEGISSMKVDLRLPERYFGQVRPGQNVQLSFDSLPGKTFVAQLQAIDAQIDANGRSLLARGRLPNPDGALRAGMFARARVALREIPDGLVVPEEAIIPQGTEVIVWRIDGNVARRTRIETGLRRDGKVEVVKGLSVDDRVVTAGQLRLQRDGQEIRIVDPNRRPGGGPPGGPGDASVPGGAPTSAGPSPAPAIPGVSSAQAASPAR